MTTREGAAELDDEWSEIQVEEHKLRSDPGRYTRSSKGFEAFARFDDAAGGMDSLGTARVFLNECVERGYPWVATKVAIEALDNAFANAAHPGGSISTSMVWNTAQSLTKVLAEGRHYFQLAEF